MKRWHLFYLASVVLPLSLALWATGYLSSGEVERLRFEEDRRIAETGAALLRRDLAAAEASGTDLIPSFLHTLEGAGGYEASLYLRGVKIAATGDDVGPDTLPARIHRRLALFPRGQAWSINDVGAALYPLDVVDGGPPALVILTAPSWTRDPTLPWGLLRLSTGLGLFLGFLGWRRFRPPFRPRRLRPWALARMTILWVILPLAVAWLLVFFMTRGFQEDARERTVRELARSLAIIRSEGGALPPAEAGRLTGFDVTVLGADGIVETTLTRPGARAAIGSIRPPPAAFTVTGTVGAGDDEAVYVASRRQGDATLVLSYPRPREHPRALGLRLVVLAIGMGLFALLFPLMVAREARGALAGDFLSGSVRGSDGGPAPASGARSGSSS